MQFSFDATTKEKKQCAVILQNDTTKDIHK